MDEPFSALDPVTRVSLQGELLKLQSLLHKTIVFVTHDMDEALKLADKICIMDHGTIIQYDTPENILRNFKNDFVRDFVGKKRIWSFPQFIHARDIMLPPEEAAHAEELLTSGAASVTGAAALPEILAIFEQQEQKGEFYLPVTEDGKLSGIITERRLVQTLGDSVKP